MPFLLLLLFALICLQGRWPDPPAGMAPRDSVLAMAGVIFVFWLLAWGIALAYQWRLARDPARPHALLRRFGKWRRMHTFGLIFAYLGTLYYLGWGKFLADLCFREVQRPSGELARQIDVPGFEVYLFAPLLVGLILSWERFYLMEWRTFERRNAPDHFISKGTFLSLQIRHNLLIVMPPMILLMLHQLLTSLVPDTKEYEAWLPALGFLLMIGALVCIPWLLRAFLGLKPLPPGPLRDRLEATARRLGFRYSNVLVWDTRHSVANAMVTGFVPWVRYIVLTDRLIDELSPDEIEAVFGHEVGHVKYLHMPTYVLFCLISLLIVAGVTAYLQEKLREVAMQAWVQRALSEWGEYAGTLELGLNVVAILIVAAYIFFIFGFLSRRCERQADLYGCRTVSCEAFVSALEKVADVNGIPRDRAGNWFMSWQHPTIGERIDFLRRASLDPGLEPRFHASLRVMKWGLVGTLGLVVALLFWLMEPDKIWDNVLRWM